MARISTLRRSLAVAACALAAGLAPLAATAAPHGGGHGWHGRGGHGHGHWGWGGVGVGVGIGIGLSPWAYGYPWGYYPGYVVATPAYPVVVAPAETAMAPAAPAAPDPVVYPRNGQSAAQTEADRRECDRWAMTQPRAMADASVFHRATIACLEGRGYTIR